jgi:hypothetical protein
MVATNITSRSIHKLHEKLPALPPRSSVTGHIAPSAVHYFTYFVSKGLVKIFAEDLKELLE